MKLTHSFLLILALSFGGAVQAADLNLDGIEDNAEFTLDLNSDGWDDRSETSSYSTAVTPSAAATDQSILVAHVQNPHVYFGWYRTSMMTSPGWDIFQRTIDWATGGIGNRVILFTYNGNVDYTSPNNDGMAVRDYLLANGYSVELHFQGDAATLPSSYYGNFDMAVYVNGYGYDASNIVASGIPFITTSAQHSDDIGFGDGTSTLHEYRDNFYIIDDSFGIVTAPYTVGPLTFSQPMWTDGLTPNANGVPLVVADQPVVATVNIFPPSGTMASTTQFDLTLIVQDANINNITNATLDGSDVTAAANSCFAAGTVLAGGETRRCPGLSGSFLGAGSHNFSITMDLSDGTTVTRSASWDVIENSEP